jgi:hypothetical protein
MTAILRNKNKNSKSLIKSALCHSDASLNESVLFSYLLSNSITAVKDNQLINIFDYRSSACLLINFTFDLQAILAYIIYKEESFIYQAKVDSNYYTKVNNYILKPDEIIKINYRILNVNPSAFIEEIFETVSFSSEVRKYFNVNLDMGLIEADIPIREKMEYAFDLCKFKNKEFRELFLNITSVNNRYAAARVLVEYFGYKQQTIDIILGEVEKWVANSFI